MDFCLSLDLSTGCISNAQGKPQGGNTRLLTDNGAVVGLVVGYSDLTDSELGSWSRASSSDIRTRAQCAGGNFVCVFWHDRTLTVVTDSSGSIPLFYAWDTLEIVLGTTSQDVAIKAGGKALDKVSVADFIHNGAVCHPYSLYESVWVFPPGAITQLGKEGVSSCHYWQPEEPSTEFSLEEYAADLKSCVAQWLRQSLAGTAKASVMFSGGEDSRALVNLLPEGPDYRLKTIVDGVNREYRLAQRAARKLGYNVELIKRPAGHYSQQIPDKVHWAGAGLDVRHYHVFNQTASLLGDSTAIIGGLGSDKLFKSLFMSNVVNKQKTGFLPENLASDYGLVPTNIGLPEQLLWLSPSLREAVWNRHHIHHMRIREFRPKTAGNWHTLWPLGGHSQGHSQFLNNLRFGPKVVEPFIASASYRLAAGIPDKYKIDRKLFNAAFLPVMGDAAWVPTTSGRVPAITGVNGRAVQFCIKSWRVLLDEVLKYRHKGNYLSQGPWSSEHKHFPVKSVADILGSDRALALDELLASISAEHCAGTFWQHNALMARERKILALQVGVLLKPLTGRESEDVAPLLSTSQCVTRLASATRQG